MGQKKTYEVNLSTEERAHLENIVSSGVEKARKLTRARILLKASRNWTDKEICNALDVGSATVGRVRKKFAEAGLDAALNRKKSSRHYATKIDGHCEAHLIALVCGPVPEGRARWTVRLLTEHLIELEQVELESVSHETVRQALKKTNLSLGKTNNG